MYQCLVQFSLHLLYLLLAPHLMRHHWITWVNISCLYCMHVSDLTHCIVSPPSTPVKPTHVSLPLLLHLHFHSVLISHSILNHPHPRLSTFILWFNPNLPHHVHPSSLQPIPSSIPSPVHCGCAVCVAPPQPSFSPSSLLTAITQLVEVRHWLSTSNWHSGCGRTTWYGQ